ncbi:transcriptional regulator [Tessaracoccus lapidicaptus]|uniref:Transcriptional regulator n=1 Tax=Tessaracoccus lapidicaptus TaxID=1427523 RepID=A0A1C0AQ20_9ACTN|nr:MULTISPECIES: LacI family DNA-binding transcriptional regulator [Tessaracoccus]AQX15328.1 transcriptional regulator [Tessaracoccus sp. T2.5-30]OCL36350.1 transcriptional regulator [Tessaracoccus lapidicaptus]VEP39609.1 Lactose operon repressor [Tessaracoccus lapidicaptus]
MRPSGPATMKDVAERAGVSVPTVSRFLSGAARVSEDKRLRIAAAVADLGFTPNAAARALVGRPPQVVSVLTGDTSRYGYAETIRGVEEAARAAGFVVTITALDSAADEAVAGAVALAMSQPIAGVVVLKFDAAGAAALERLPAWLPTVALAGARERGRAQAVIREEDGARLVVEHLLGLGHPTVHHLRVPAQGGELGRTAGWRAALRAAGRPEPEVLETTWEPAAARRIGHLLAERHDVTALFCGNDEVAMGVAAGLRDRGVAVPRDISLVGFDDHPIAELWDPALTTVRQDFAELGRRGWRMLAGRIQGSTSTRLVSLTPDVILRASTAPPSAGRTAP